MRSAIEKYFSSGICATEIDAIEKFNEEYVIPKLEQFN